MKIMIDIASKYRVLRGGCWSYESRSTPLDDRAGNLPHRTRKFSGCRLIVEAR